MSERPILFSGAMVRAILDGRKTQTRRVVKHSDGIPNMVPDHGVKRVLTDIIQWWRSEPYTRHWACPYGQPGDVLWVRETFALIDNDYKPADLRAATSLVYRADGLRVPNQRDPENRALFAGRCAAPLDAIKWKPSIFMPRIASRLTLRIKSVRVERLQDISEQDALNEGVFKKTGHMAGLGDVCETVHGGEVVYANPSQARDYFYRLWDSINAKRAPWASNPWVWCVEFERA